MSATPSLVIRSYGAADWPAVWAILEPVFRAGETYAVARDIDEAAARAMWTAPAKVVFVAADAASGVILGSYFVKPNQDGPGAHVCNAGYVVAEHARGRGVAAEMCRHSLVEAAALGFRAMQYNLVVSSNETAVRLWQRMGFAIVGTLPGAFCHSRLGDVDAFVMYRSLV